MDQIIKGLEHYYKRTGAYTFQKKTGAIIRIDNFHKEMNVNLSDFNTFFIEVILPNGLKNNMICPLNAEKEELYHVVNRLIKQLHKPTKNPETKINNEPPIAGVKL